MGIELGPNKFFVFQKRGSRMIKVGTIDPDLRLYQWAPSRDAGTVQNCSYHGKMSFGVEEWEQIVKNDVRYFEFKEGPSGYLYRGYMRTIKHYAEQVETPAGMRVLVPLECFRIVRDKDRKIIKKETL